MNISTKVCLVLCSLILVACNKAPETKETVQASKLGDMSASSSAPSKDASPVTQKGADGKTYSNEFFQMTVEKPDGWYAQNEEEAVAVQKQGGKMLAGNDKNLKAVLEIGRAHVWTPVT